MDARCVSIQSKKNPGAQCRNRASRGEFCAHHVRTRIRWASGILPIATPLTQTREIAGIRISRWMLRHIPLRLRIRRGPSYFTPEVSHNDNDLYSLESITTIPKKYHCSYMDENRHVWTFDVRFLIQCMHEGNIFKNPFSQEELPQKAICRLQSITQFLRIHQLPTVYVDTDVLTPEQIWNQKVIDVFLQLGNLGYGANVLWFETLTVRGHELFYRHLYRLWHVILAITDDVRELLVPGFNAGRAPLFRWHPIALEGQGLDIKWWRKQTLKLMSTFITRSTDRAYQGCGALYVLTALANSHPRAAEAYPWLMAD